jgi:DNA-directed RNA polymerase specialized sigma subunit
MRLNEKERGAYIYESMRRTVQQLMRRREGLFGDLSVIDIPDSKHEPLIEDSEEAEELSPEALAAQRTEDVWDDEEEGEESDELGYEDELEEHAAWPVGHDTGDSIRFADIDEYLKNLPGKAADPLERIIIAEVTSEMRKVLSDQLWQIVEARYIDDLGVRIIAEQLGLSAQAVQKQLAKAQEILRNHFLYGSRVHGRKISNASQQHS